MRSILLFVLAACGSSGSDSTSDPDPRKDPTTWPDELGGARPAPVFAPSDYDGKSELPVILALHGFGVNGLVQDLVYQLGSRVDRYGFVLILPTGTTDPDGNNFWNATEACCNFHGSDVDDSGYLAGLLDQAEAAFPVDPDRLYVLGHSNGGYMSYRMACDHSERIAAIAPLAGNTFRDEADCHANSDVSVLHVHGTIDEDVSYGPTAFSVGAVDSLGRWADRAGCTGDPVDGGRADFEALVDGEETAILRYGAGCADGFAGELWSMEGVGHLPGFTEAFRDAQVEWLLERRNLRSDRDQRSKP